MPGPPELGAEPKKSEPKLGAEGIGAQAGVQMLNQFLWLKCLRLAASRQSLSFEAAPGAAQRGAGGVRQGRGRRRAGAGARAGRLGVGASAGCGGCLVAHQGTAGT